MSLLAYGGMVSCGGGRYGAVVRLGTNIQFNSCNNGFNTSASGKIVMVIGINMYSHGMVVIAEKYILMVL